MADDDTYDMYDTDGMDIPKARDDGFKLSSTSRGMMLEIDINGHKVEVINPEYVQDLQRLIQNLNERIAVLDRTVKSMVFDHRKQQQSVSSLQTQLDRKIDRE